jgi:general secretion pathway protein A
LRATWIRTCRAQGPSYVFHKPTLYWLFTIVDQMFLEHFQLREPPFSISPDPRFVFLSERHRDALAHLLYGVGQGSSGGFVCVTGEVGTGKTTLCRLLLEQLPPNTRVALILNPMLSPIELLEAIGKELHIPLRGKQGHQKRLIDALNIYLLQAYAEGLRVVLIIDEAQNLSAEALEQVRLLTNLETNTQKLLQIILLGQPELRDLLARRDLRQLSQRITARFHLTPLTEIETQQYLRHRFAIAGGPQFPFSADAMHALFKYSKGIPRLLNIIADRALLAAYVHENKIVDKKLVSLAAKEILPTQRQLNMRRILFWFFAALLASLLGFGLRYYFDSNLNQSGVEHVANS